MTRKTFAIVAAAGVAALAGLAAGLRPSSSPADNAAKTAAAGPAVETIVTDRTRVLRGLESDNGRSSGDGSPASAARMGAPAPKTAASSTGDEDEGHAQEHGAERGDDHEGDEGDKGDEDRDHEDGHERDDGHDRDQGDGRDRGDGRDD